MQQKDPTTRRRRTPRRQLDALDFAAIMKLPRPRYLIDGIIAQDGIVLWHGPPNVGKTTLAIDCACSLSCRPTWLGARVVCPGASLMVAAENPASYAARLAAWRDYYQPDTPIAVHVIPQAIDLLDPHDVTGLLRLAVRIEPQVIFLDTLSRCHSADENSTVEMRQVMDVLVDIRRRTETTLIALHHPGLSNTRRGRGSSVVGADVDTVIEVHKTAKKSDTGDLICHKQRDAALFTPLGFRLVPTGNSIVSEATAVTLTPADKALLATLDGRRMTASEWERRSGLTESTFYRRLRDLVRAGVVRPEGTGKGKAYVRVAV